METTPPASAFAQPEAPKKEKKPRTEKQENALKILKVKREEYQAKKKAEKESKAREFVSAPVSAPAPAPVPVPVSVPVPEVSVPVPAPAPATMEGVIAQEPKKESGQRVKRQIARQKKESKYVTKEDFQQFLSQIQNPSSIVPSKTTQDSSNAFSNVPPKPIQPKVLKGKDFLDKLFF